MMRYLRTTASTLTCTAIVLALTVAAAGQSNGQPVWFDDDMQSIPEPKGHEDGYAYDFVDGTVFQQIKQYFDFPRGLRLLSGKRKEAHNVNRVGGVPDSSWFTNRNGRRRMTVEEIQRGPDQDSGPVGETITVVAGKTAGISPGFTIKDERGQAYLLKFDPPEYPELATAAEVISTKLFYAIGYNVPQNTIFRFRREQLVMAKDATFKDEFGRKRKMTWADLEQILSRLAREPQGRFRAVASKLLPGKPKGGFSFVGVRQDDANDIIPHEHRRDLRGLRIFSAWLEHNDIRVGNTLDVYVVEDGRSFLRHYLIDLGSTLGSDTVFPNVPIVGHEHQLDLREAAKVLLTAGIYQPPWHQPRAVKYRSVGVYSAEDFNPRRWKQNFPLVAFENMTEADAVWAAEIVASFSDEQIAAAVDTGEISDPAAKKYLTDQIVARRDKIISAYLQRPARTMAASKD